MSGAVFCALLLFAAPAVRAQPTEAAVKAAFIPKFARYVAWPAATHPGARDPFHLCVIGRDPFGPLLDSAASREAIDGHAVTVRRMATAGSAAGCHLAFVQGANARDTTRMLLALRGRPVLTITDSRGGGSRGMVHFTVSGGRVRFFIDEAAAAEHGLTISSRLLALALGVRQRRS
ncbi:MAG: YfiR family protein [Allosphingosinicella sp.]